jgi:hypothetical protein
MEPEFELTLDNADRAYLVSLVSMHGYKVLHKIIKASTYKFVTRLLNTKNSAEKDVLSNHLAAQVAAQLYDDWTKEINFIVEQYTHTPKASDAPVDITSGILDLGDEVIENVLNTYEDILEER